MTARSAIDKFLSNETLAVVGVSGSDNKFGYAAWKELKKGFKVYPINPRAETIDDEPCYSDLKSIPGGVRAVLVVVPPEQTEQVVTEAVSQGIEHIWLQQGAESERAIQICRENGVNVIYGECILMFAEPAGFAHRLHRGIWKIFGKFPQA